MGETQLRTFLIADIRGYTTYTRENGDEAAAVLAGQFAALVREVVATRGGFLLELRGDEALVVFVSPRQALRASVELQERFRAELPRGVGIGLDAGEAVPVESGYRGSALNVAARLCAQAGPGEILASEAVIHLAARVEGVSYVEPRSYRLKGLGEPVRAVRVVGEGRGPRGFRRNLRRARTVLPVDRRSQAVAAIAVVALAAVGLTAWGVIRGRAPTASGSPPAASPGTGGTLAGIGLDALPALAFVDPATGQLLDTVEVRNPVDMQFLDGSFWVLGLNPQAIYRIDPGTRKVVQTITIPLVKLNLWTIDHNVLWLTDGGSAAHVIGIDIGSQVVVRDFSLTTDPEDLATAQGVAVGGGSLWVSRPGANEVVRLDPVSGEVQARIDAIVPDSLAFGEGALWVTGAGRITRIDPATNRASFSPKELALDQPLPFIAFGGGQAWTAEEEQGIVWKVDRSGSVTGTYPTGAGARPLSFSDGFMWVGNQDEGTISAIDVVTGEVTTLKLGHSLVSIAATGGQILVSVWPGIDEQLATLQGKVLKIAMPGDPFQGVTPDPPLNGAFEYRQLEYATCASLLAYPDKPAPDGWSLQPEVAEALPDLSADGLTYTFRIRGGFKFSPPSNEPVTAETFRYSIQRALSQALGPYNRGISFLDDIVGARAFHDGRAKGVEGLSAAGNTLSIKLDRPSPDFLKRLALPYFCPVPINTPVVLDGVDPEPPLPSAGPYYVSEHHVGELALLLPNPNYAGARPRNYDHIALRLGVDAADAVALVRAGRMDAAITGPFRSLLSPAGDLARQWGPGSEPAANGDQRWFGAPRFALDFIAVNPESDLFSDVDVRHAVSLALDRTAIAAPFDEAPTANLLPPSVPGSLSVDTPVPKPDVAAALKLMAGKPDEPSWLSPGPVPIAATGQTPWSATWPRSASSWRSVRSTTLSHGSSNVF